MDFAPGPLAPGMDLRCRICLTANAIGRVDTQFEVMCKSEIYYIPIQANVVDVAQWEELESESYRINGRSALKTNVRQVDIMMDLPDQMISSTSESKMPRIPSLKQSISVDPEKSLAELKQERDEAKF